LVFSVVADLLTGVQRQVGHFPCPPTLRWGVVPLAWLHGEGRGVFQSIGFSGFCAGATYFQSALHLFGSNGVLVKKVVGGVTTVYIGSHYEKQGGTVIKYYSFHGQRIAMNKAGVVYWLAGDHLGTTSVVLNSSGNKVAEARHYPYGGERWHSGTLPTDFTTRHNGCRANRGDSCSDQVLPTRAICGILTPSQ